MSKKKAFFTRQETAKLLGVSVKTITRRIMKLGIRPIIFTPRRGGFGSGHWFNLAQIKKLRGLS